MNCKLCGAKDIQPSFGGVDICGTCDCLGFCRRCKILAEENIKENERMKREPIPSKLLDLVNTITKYKETL